VKGLRHVVHRRPVLIPRIAVLVKDPGALNHLERVVDQRVLGQVGEQEPAGAAGCRQDRSPGGHGREQYGGAPEAVAVGGQHDARPAQAGQAPIGAGCGELDPRSVGQPVDHG